MPLSTGERRPHEGDELMNVAAPSKRRKIEACRAVAVKQERSPSPPLIHSRRSPQVSGVTFVKYPSDCSPSHANWKANRSRCSREETAKLEALGLTIKHTLSRDDGLAFDWSSKVPVDCVTLKPPSSTRNPSQPARGTVQPTTDTSQPTRDTAQSTENISRRASDTSQPTRNSHSPRNASQARDSSRTTRSLSQPERNSSRPRGGTTQIPTNSDDIPPNPDLLGHALQDQVTICQTLESSEPAVEPAAPDVARLMNIDRSMAEASSGESLEFTVVGAAIKDTALSGDHQPASNSSSPKEYRRLIPPDLRIYRQNINNKFPYRFNEPAARRKRRIEWIEKEVAKIEGYTGEKVTNYRYDGNYVIIILENKNHNASSVSNYRPPSRPIPITPNSKVKQPLPKPRPRIVSTLRKPPVHVSPHATTAQPPTPVLERPQSATPLQLTTRPTPPPTQIRDNIPTKRHPSLRSSLSSTFPTQPVTPIPSTTNLPAASAQLPSNPSAASTSNSNTARALPPPISAAGTSNSNTTRPLSPPISISSDSELPSPRTFFASLGKSPPARGQASSESSDLKNIESRGLQFLERYLMLYDANRQDLASAFTPNATFILTDDVTHGTKPRQVVNSPSAISQAIQNLDDGLHRSIKSNISYDMTPLDDVDPGAMMLVCDGAVVPRDHSTPTRTFSRTFILRRNTNHDRNLWPLKIAVEKLILKPI